MSEYVIQGRSYIDSWKQLAREGKLTRYHFAYYCLARALDVKNPTNNSVYYYAARAYLFYLDQFTPCRSVRHLKANDFRPVWIPSFNSYYGSFFDEKLWNGTDPSYDKFPAVWFYRHVVKNLNEKFVDLEQLRAIISKFEDYIHAEESHELRSLLRKQCA